MPSRSMEVSRISPAPRETASFAHAIASRPVGFRPPCDNTPTGTMAHPLLWSPTGNYFYCNPDAAPDFNYTLVPHLMCQLSTTNVPGTDGTNFYLDASLTPLPTNSRVVCLMIPGVLGSDAAQLSNQYDNKNTSTATAAVTTGRVAYAVPNATTGLTTVYMYVANY